MSSYTIRLARELVEDARANLATVEYRHRAGELTGDEFLDRWALAYQRLQSALAYRWLVVFGPYKKNPYLNRAHAAQRKDNSHE